MTVEICKPFSFVIFPCRNMEPHIMNFCQHTKMFKKFPYEPGYLVLLWESHKGLDFYTTYFVLKKSMMYADTVPETSIAAVRPENRPSKMEWIVFQASIFTR